MAASTSSSRPHMVLFPFMSKGHIIPLLDLARLLLHRNITVTIFTTPENRPFISDTLSDTDASIVDLPFPHHIEGVPAGVESTDNLPSISLFFPFTSATKVMQPYFEKALETFPYNITALISDGFLWWTQESATKYGIPRVVSYGMNNYSWAVLYAVMKHGLLSGPEHDDEPIVLTDFPWIKVTRNDFDEPLNSRDPKGPYVDFFSEVFSANSRSYGILANSFYELEAFYFEYCNRRESEPKTWCIGPLCLAEPLKTKPPSFQKPTWLKWLDQKLAEGRSVLYVAFGTQAEISSQQLHEIAIGLEESKVNFFWVTRKVGPEIDNGFEERVKGRGLVVREWVDQRSILRHESVQGFLSHCGWNSVSESICANVPILCWPMMAEQHINARMVVEEIKVGLRVQTSNGSARGFVKSEGLKKMVRELMESDKGKEVREKVKEFGEAAKKAMEEGGSSWHSLNQLIGELQALSR